MSVNVAGREGGASWLTKSVTDCKFDDQQAATD